MIFRSSVRTTRKIEVFRVFAARSTHDADIWVIDPIECWMAFCRMIVFEHSIRRDKYMSRRQQTPKQSEKFYAEKLARRGVSRVPTYTAGIKMRLPVGNQVIEPRKSAVSVRYPLYDLIIRICTIPQTPGSRPRFFGAGRRQRSRLCRAFMVQTLIDSFVEPEAPCYFSCCCHSAQ